MNIGFQKLRSDSFPILENFLNVISKRDGYSVISQTISDYLTKESALIVTANGLFFMIMNSTINYLIGDVKEKNYKQILIGESLFTGSSLAFNLLLAKVLKVQLTYITFALITAGHLFLHLCVNQFFRKKIELSPKVELKLDSLLSEKTSSYIKQLENKVQQLSAEKSTLEDEKKSAITEASQLNQKVVQLEKEKTSLDLEKGSFLERLKNLESDLQSVTERKKKCEADLLVAQNNAKSETEITVLKDKVAEENKKVAHLQKEKDTIEVKITDLTACNLLKDDQIIQLRDEMKKLEEENKKAMVETEDSKKKILKSETEIAVLKDKAAEENKKVAHLQKEKDAIEVKLTDLTACNLLKDDQIIQLRDAMKKLEEEKKKAIDETEDSKKKILSLEEERKKLEETRHLLLAKQRDLQDNLKTFYEMEASLQDPPPVPAFISQDELDELKRKNSELDAEKRTLLHEMIKLKKLFDAAKKNDDTSETKMMRLRRDYDEIKNEHKALQGKLDKIEEEKRELEENLRKLENNASLDRVKLEDTLAELETLKRQPVPVENDHFMGEAPGLNGLLSTLTDIWNDGAKDEIDLDVEGDDSTGIITANTEGELNQESFQAMDGETETGDEEKDLLVAEIELDDSTGIITANTEEELNQESFQAMDEETETGHEEKDLPVAEMASIDKNASRALLSSKEIIDAENKFSESMASLYRQRDSKEEKSKDDIKVLRCMVELRVLSDELIREIYSNGYREVYNNKDLMGRYFQVLKEILLEGSQEEIILVNGTLRRHGEFLKKDVKEDTNMTAAFANVSHHLSAINTAVDKEELDSLINRIGELRAKEEKDPKKKWKLKTEKLKTASKINMHYIVAERKGNKILNSKETLDKIFLFLKRIHKNDVLKVDINIFLNQLKGSKWWESIMEKKNSEESKSLKTSFEELKKLLI